MSRLFGLPAIAPLILLAVGCSPKVKPASAFVRECDVAQTFNLIAKQAGVTQSGFSFGGTTNSITGTSRWDVKLRYCARPDQIDEVMRVVYAEFVKKLRESGAGPGGGGAPPPGPAAVKEWSIAYSAGTQVGTIRVTRNDGTPGQCQGKEQLEYTVDFVLDEAPKTP